MPCKEWDHVISLPTDFYSQPIWWRSLWIPQLLFTMDNFSFEEACLMIHFRSMYIWASIEWWRFHLYLYILLLSYWVTYFMIFISEFLQNLNLTNLCGNLTTLWNYVPVGDFKNNLLVTLYNSIITVLPNFNFS